MTNDIDWNDPVARYNLIEAVGHEEYNRRIKAYLDANPVRPVNSRFGTLWAVGNTGKAFATRNEAEEFFASINATTVTANGGHHHG